MDIKNTVLPVLLSIVVTIINDYMLKYYRINILSYISKETLIRIIIFILSVPICVFAYRKIKQFKRRYPKQSMLNKMSESINSGWNGDMEDPNVGITTFSKILEDECIDYKDMDENEIINDLWCIIPEIELHKYDDYIKVWIMGRFKAGKSTILNKLGVKEAEGSTIKHTIGEVFLLLDKEQILFVDSEGFEQAVNVDEPELRMNFIINHARKCADYILLVLPMMSTNDRKLMMKSIRMLKGQKFQLIIIHNLMTFNT